MKSKEDISGELSDISPFLAGIQKPIPYHVPEDYFAELPRLILANIQQKEKRENEISSELAVIAPLLNTISKKQVQAVPNGYFNQVIFTPPVFQEQKKPASVVKPPSIRRWLPMAAAAVITGILITGAFLFTDNRDNYIEYEKYTRMDMPAGLTGISEADIEKYLNEPEHTVFTQSATVPVSEEAWFDVNNTIQLLSDEVLSQYITENTDPAETGSAAKK